MNQSTKPDTSTQAQRDLDEAVRRVVELYGPNITAFSEAVTEELRRRLDEEVRKREELRRRLGEEVTKSAHRPKKLVTT